MAIQNRSEFDFVMSDVTLKVDRLLNEGGKHPALVEANRNLKRVAEHLRKGDKPTPQEIKTFMAAASLIRDTLKDDDLYDRTFDIEDFVQGLA